MGKAARLLLPWPARHERRQAVADAEQEKHRSQAGAAHAADVERDIRRMAAENHFAEVIAASLRQGHRNGGV